MSRNQISIAETHRELSRLMYPLSKRVQHRIEQMLRNREDPVPIRLWNEFPVDGYAQYNFCLQNSIPISVEHMMFENLDEAIVYVCATQIERSDLSIPFRRYLLGKLYASELAISHSGRRYTGPHSNIPICTFCKYTSRNVDITSIPRNGEWTIHRLGQAYGISRVSVRSYKRFANAIDIIREKDAEMAEIILSGICRLTYKEVEQIANMNNAEISQYRYGFLQAHKPIRRSKKQSPETANETEAENKPPEKNIKNMPEYDPDAEASTLIFTIPSWCSSMERFLRTDLSVISEKAKQTLLREVQALQDKTLELQIEMEE